MFMRYAYTLLCDYVKVQLNKEKEMITDLHTLQIEKTELNYLKVKGTKLNVAYTGKFTKLSFL